MQGHFKFSPNTLRKLRRFRSIRRCYFSFLILAVLVSLAAVGPFWVNNRAILMLLVLIAFVVETVRETFDPKKFTTYQ